MRRTRGEASQPRLSTLSHTEAIAGGSSQRHEMKAQKVAPAVQLVNLVEHSNSSLNAPDAQYFVVRLHWTIYLPQCVSPVKKWFHLVRHVIVTALPSGMGCRRNRWMRLDTGQPQR